MLVFVKACHVIFNEYKQFHFKVTGCCLVTFVWCYSIGEVRKCLNHDLRKTSIFPPCEKGSNIQAKIYVCQWVQALHAFPSFCRMTTRTLDSVRSNNWIRFEFYIDFWLICSDIGMSQLHFILHQKKIKMVHKRTTIHHRRLEVCETTCVNFEFNHDLLLDLQ